MTVVFQENHPQASLSAAVAAAAPSAPHTAYRNISNLENAQEPLPCNVRVRTHTRTSAGRLRDFAESARRNISTLFGNVKNMGRRAFVLCFPTVF
jgi:hypothetical protein